MIDDLYLEMDELEAMAEADWHEPPTCWVCDGHHSGRGCPVDSEPRGSWFGYEDRW